MKYYIKIDENNKVKDCINYTLLNNEINLNGEGSVVEGFIEVESVPETVLNGNWEYDILTKTYTENKPEEAMITPAQFLKRLTFDELNKVTNYDKFISTNDADYVAKCMAMKSLWTLFNTFEMVNLGDANWVADFVQVVVWTGLLTLERVIEITKI